METAQRSYALFWCVDKFTMHKNGDVRAQQCAATCTVPGRCRGLCRVFSGFRSGARGWPDLSPRPAKLSDITAFIEGNIDEALLADLIWGLSLVDWDAIHRLTEQTNANAPP